MHCQKKGKGKGNSKAVLVIIEGKTPTILKGDDARERLKEEGRGKMINFYRCMILQEMNDGIDHISILNPKSHYSGFQHMPFEVT